MELNLLRDKYIQLLKKNDYVSEEIKKVELKLERFNKNAFDEESRMKSLENDNKWILQEKSFFGTKESEYDFTHFDEKTESEKLTKLREENAVLKRKVNMKVDMMSDQYEKEYQDLIKKREIITKDKTNIELAIKEMDIKRKEAIEEIYDRVNKELNSIYSTLLPGAGSKLEKLEGKSIMDGLELKVSFNNTWKKSLSELSGGQRSLLALSLILSLLIYKPAPFYILDEIDAALDLSHTQNLGIMIKQHFPQSQFIVVSLKDGMFNNANVLFRVSFSDGSSKVERIGPDEEKKKR